MYRLKIMLARLAQFIAHYSGVSTRRAGAGSGGRILMYHGVGVADCRADVFESQIRFLTEHFQIVSLSDMVTGVQKQPEELDGKIALTFDDGLRNNFTVAYPVLKKYRAPATFFICPGLIDRGAWLWNVEARCRMKSLAAGELSRLADGLGRFGASPNQVVDWMKTLPFESRRHVEEVIRRETRTFTPGERLRSENDLMSWDEVRQLDPALISIGAHTTNHPILKHCTPEELTAEVSECGQRIEDHIHRPVEHFCYPNGDFNETVVRYTEKNYRAAVTTQPGYVRGGASVHQLPRIGSTHNLTYLSWRLHRPFS